MKTLEIYFRDLVPEAQEAALALFGIKSPQDANWDSFPLFTLEVETYPLGGDTENDCADCAYSPGFHFKDGECVRRKEENVNI